MCWGPRLLRYTLTPFEITNSERTVFDLELRYERKQLRGGDI